MKTMHGSFKGYFQHINQSKVQEAIEGHHQLNQEDGEHSPVNKIYTKWWRHTRSHKTVYLYHYMQSSI